MAKLTYTNVNGYLIPNLTCKSDERMGTLGKYANSARTVRLF